MARKLRVEYPGAIYHVMNSGDRREFLSHTQLTSLALWGNCFVVNGIAVRGAVGRQRHRSAYAEHAPGGCFQSFFGPFPVGKGVNQMRANASGEHLKPSSSAGQQRRTRPERGQSGRIACF